MIQTMLLHGYTPGTSCRIHRPGYPREGLRAKLERDSVWIFQYEASVQQVSPSTGRRALQLIIMVPPAVRFPRKQDCWDHVITSLVKARLISPDLDKLRCDDIIFCRARCYGTRLTAVTLTDLPV